VARKLEVELIAHIVPYTRGLVKAAEQTKLFARTVDDSSKHIGRSLAFATGGFVAFAGATEFLRSSIDAARDAGVSQRSLAAQMKASGESFTASQGRIEKAGLALEKFGFTSEDSAKALTVLERGSGSITRAISLQGAAADLARAKNLDLADAANVLAKVFGGQETALRRAVPGLDKHAHGLDLIAQAQQRLAGQAKAGTTEAERFHATLHDTEVIIGTALLPTLNKFLESIGKWLQKMNESGRLQKDVNEAVKIGTGLFDDAKTALDGLNKITGSTKHTLELLFGVLVAFKTAKFATVFLDLASSIKRTGTAAKTTEGEVAALRLSFVGRLGVAAAVVAAGYELSTFIEKIPGWNSAFEGLGGKIYDVASALHLVHAGGPSFAEVAAMAAAANKTGPAGPLGTPTRPALTGPVGAPSVNVPGHVAGQTFQNPALSAAQARAIGLASDPNNLALLRAQAARDRAAIAFAEKLRARGTNSNAKYVAEVTAYASDLKQTNDTIAGILQAATQAAADKTKAAAEKTKAAAEAARAAAAQAQQGLLDKLQLNVDRTQLTKGLQDDLSALQAQKAGYQEIIRTEGATHDLLETLLGVELAIAAKKQEIADARAGKKQAQADKAAKQVQAKLDAANLLVAKSGLTETLKDDLAANKNLLAVMKATGAAAIDIVNQQVAINGLKGQLADQIAAGKKSDDKAAGTADQANQSTRRLFQRLSASGFVNRFGAGLSGAQKRRLEVGFAMTGPGGTLPAGHSGQFTAGLVINGGVHMHGVHDVAGLENELAKRAKARPAIRRGTRG
jgi:hypothetical protein